jgi:two-component system response regulator (stage 0 sporulation protein F)
MTLGILIVDDQRDILRLLHATLDTLKNKDLQILEAPSGEEALLEASRHKIDLLITDYLLPGITGVELMRKIRIRNPEVKVILITGMTDRKARDEMLNAGAIAIFDKPIPLADFLDCVERGLGLVRTIFPPEAGDAKMAARHSRVSDLLANFRQDINAQAVFLLNEKGMVQARAGDLRDSSMEVSLLSALMAIHAAGLKVSRYIHQDALDAYYVFSGGDHDLLFIPVNPTYTMLLAGDGLARESRILETVAALLAVRNEVDRALRSMGVTGELATPPEPVTRPLAGSAPDAVKKKAKTHELPSEPPSPEMEALLKEAANKKKAGESDVNAFWDQAAQKHGKVPTNPEVITLEEARKRGLLPDEGKQ